MFQRLTTPAVRHVLEENLGEGGPSVISLSDQHQDPLTVVAAMDALLDAGRGTVAPEWIAEVRRLCDEYPYYYPRNIPFGIRMTGYAEEECIRLTGRITSIQVTPQGEIIAGGDRLGIWSRAHGGEWSFERITDDFIGTECLHALPDGRIATGSKHGIVRIFTREGDGSWGSETLGGHEGAVLCIQALSNGKFVSGGDDGSLRIWDRGQGGAWNAEVLTGHQHGVSCVHVFPDGTMISGSHDRTVRWWGRTEDGIWRSNLIQDRERPVYCLGVLPDGNILTGGRGGVRLLTREPEGWQSQELPGYRSVVQSIQVLADGRFFTGDQLNRVCHWIPADGGWRREPLYDHAGEVRSLQVLPDGRVMSGGADRTIRIWSGTAVGFFG